MQHDRYSSKPAGRPVQKLIGGGKTLNISVLRFVAFPLVLIIIVSFLCVSCEKEISHDYPELQAYYTESCHLNVATRDSVLRFTNKVADFVEVNPEAKYDPIYPEIVNNVNHVLFGVWINTEWDGEEHLYY